MKNQNSNLETSPNTPLTTAELMQKISAHHSCGGWHLREGDGRINNNGDKIHTYDVVGERKSKKTICEVQGYFCSAQENLANAELIAAAPDLLRALAELLQFAPAGYNSAPYLPSPFQIAAGKARAAIERATSSPLQSKEDRQIQSAVLALPGWKHDLEQNTWSKDIYNDYKQDFYTVKIEQSAATSSQSVGIVINTWRDDLLISQSNIYSNFNDAVLAANLIANNCTRECSSP
jgi:hypothetical protein